MSKSVSDEKAEKASHFYFCESIKQEDALLNPCMWRTVGYKFCIRRAVYHGRCTT